ncbi:ADP-ribosylglycohydrolase family protein [Paludicola sp. MB14-C6]|uniref:ADP-ribosylglycohydrolase family protein n=1 Tax=Paludihabitans sp. MB14-C6 TaxID=3070656 RepID=UPI0027DD1AAC|nr:ADP-ribosylglycohydrolase family protein [Paludicola sp. MB14-C6]WMJ24114.1 ADP-ribosylglycohydrolase family protein [Paludicola sp. MB14-C6]
MKYTDFNSVNQLINQITDYANLKTEYGCEQQVEKIKQEMVQSLEQKLFEIQHIEEDEELAKKEPDLLDEIKQLRTSGPRKLTFEYGKKEFTNKMAGAILGRFIGCTLGVPVESWPIPKMKQLASQFDTPFPPTHYWNGVYYSDELHYGISPLSAYTKSGINGVPVDDDITYTLIPIFTIEKYGYNFTTRDVGEIWKTFLPVACTAEEVALNNLKKGMSIEQVGVVGNPYVQWIGADIRSDGWAYVCAGNPERAAEFAYRDAYLSHRRNGIYGEMFFAAVQAAAFCVDTPLEAIEIGLTEIPQECNLYQDVRWAIEEGKRISNYQEARDAVDKRFAGMHPVHTNNNACLTVMGLLLGNGDFTKTISEIVAMGLDNDCTAATAGSVIGAIYGAHNIPSHWTEGFHNTVYTYMNGVPSMKIDDIVKRYCRLALNNQ